MTKKKKNDDWSIASESKAQTQNFKSARLVKSEQNTNKTENKRTKKHTSNKITTNVAYTCCWDGCWDSC